MTNNIPLNRSDFSFVVPEELVAQEPLTNRQDSRLLVRQADGTKKLSKVSHLSKELPEDSLLIMNDSRVIPGRLIGHLATGGKVEIFLMNPVGGSESWKCLGKPMRKLAKGTQVTFADGLTGTVEEKNADNTVTVRFSLNAANFLAWLDQYGFIPLPPYIRRANPDPASSSPDRDRYQTVYADQAGSVAAPTAGLHLTENILDEIRSRRIDVQTVCLHVGGGTFLPVKSDDIDQHVMHEEQYLITRKVADAVVAAKKAERPVIVVGTTSFRALESFFSMAPTLEGCLENSDTWLGTDLFIRPKYKDSRHKPLVTSAIMTNFHQPESTLFMLICALVGYEEAREIYSLAVDNRFRFYSYGDSSLLYF